VIAGSFEDTGYDTAMTTRAASAEFLPENVAELEAGTGVALWRRVADELERAIAVGHYQPGMRLPPEVDIAERFDVNRHTVRRAIAALAERGLVRAERGSGTYVEAARLPYPIHARTRFSEIVGATGRAAGGRLIASAVEKAEADIAKRLKLKTGTPVVRLEKLRHADRVPLCASTTWLPASRFPDAAAIYASCHSMTKTLARYGIKNYSRQSTRATAAIVDATDALRLEIAAGRPILVIESVDADDDGCPVLTTRSRFAADRIELVIET
jgi:GntR family transcriptional regulator, phosphonate transport system regulatory protein